MHVPAHFARGVEHGVKRIEVPFLGAAHRIVPDGAGGLGVLLHEVVHQVEAVLEFRIDLDDVGVEHLALEKRAAGDFVIDRRGIDLIGVLELFLLAVMDARVFDFNGVRIVGIQPPDGNAAVGEERLTAHVVLDFGAVVLRDDANRGVFNAVAAVLDDGGERRDAVRVDDDFADVALNMEGHLGARRTARGIGGGDEGDGERCGERARNELFQHCLSFGWSSGGDLFGR